MHRPARVVAALAAVILAAVTLGITRPAPAAASRASARDPLAATAQAWRDARTAAAMSGVAAVVSSARVDEAAAVETGLAALASSARPADLAAVGGPAALDAQASVARVQAAEVAADAAREQERTAAALETYARTTVIGAIAERTGASGDELSAAWSAAPPAALDVLAAGLSELGTPYRYGGSGPDSYDCSGFVAAAYAAVGVDLPHQSGQQWGMAAPVTAAGPADVLVNPSLGHIGLAVGAGILLHAPQSGDVVKLAPVPADYRAGRLLPS
jgi:cell wall-associated NlpC family hydrolase